MDFACKFEKLNRSFVKTSDVVNSSEDVKLCHSKNVEKWFKTIDEFRSTLHPEKNALEQMTQVTQVGVNSLVDMGDEISAWLGQVRLAEYYEKRCHGLVAAKQLSLAARLSITLVMPDLAESLLDRMRSHFSETDTTYALEYWAFNGFVLKQRRKWEAAIGYLEKAMQCCVECYNNDLLVSQNRPQNYILNNLNLNIVDCWLNIGWESQAADRKKCAEKARSLLMKLITGNLSGKLDPILNLNLADLELLEGNLNAASSRLDEFVKSEPVVSKSAATMFPAAYCVYSRLASLMYDQTGMIRYLSQALTKSTQYPDAMQELLIVDFALELIKPYLMDKTMVKPLLESMVKLLEAKDWYVCGDHSSRVAQYTMRIWDLWHPKYYNHIGRDDLFWAAYLHDLGKLRLPRSLLNKIAPLSEEEWRLIHLHPMHSKEMLEMFHVREIAQWASEHHQDRFGTGYPGRNAASDMGLCIAMADKLEASTSDTRKYKSAISFDNAVSELIDGGKNKYPEDLMRALPRLEKLR